MQVSAKTEAPPTRSGRFTQIAVGYHGAGRNSVNERPEGEYARLGTGTAVQRNFQCRLEYPAVAERPSGTRGKIQDHNIPVLPIAAQCRRNRGSRFNAT
jgi:hypothetical protein